MVIAKESNKLNQLALTTRDIHKEIILSILADLVQNVNVIHITLVLYGD